MKNSKITPFPNQVYSSLKTVKFSKIISFFDPDRGKKEEITYIRNWGKRKHTKQLLTKEWIFANKFYLRISRMSELYVPFIRTTISYYIDPMLVLDKDMFKNNSRSPA